MRTPYICGNWKLNKTIAEAVEFAAAFKEAAAAANNVELGVGVQFVALKSLADAFAGTAVRVGAQDCYWEEGGAFTGEIAPGMIKDAGASFVIIGHSERRQFFGETNETANKKVRAALTAGLQVILCVGETLEERESGKMDGVIKGHVCEGLAGLSAGEMANIVIAYEPVWAIGTGVTATPEQAQEAHAFIRGLLKEQFGDAIADATRIQYGGSVKPENVKEIMGQPDVDGALVGGASLKPDSFAALAQFNQ